MHRDTHNQPKVKTTLREDVNNFIELNKYLADTGNEEWINVDHTLTLQVDEYNQFREDFKGFITANTGMLGVILVRDLDLNRELPVDGGMLDGYTVCRLDADGSFAAAGVTDYKLGIEGLFIAPDSSLNSDDSVFDVEDSDDYISGATTEGSEFWKDSHFTPDEG